MDLIVRLSYWIYALLNGLAGRSWLLDTLITLPLDNNLVKAGPIGACFVYAWWSSRDEAEMAAAREQTRPTAVPATECPDRRPANGADNGTPPRKRESHPRFPPGTADSRMPCTPRPRIWRNCQAL